MTGRRSRSPLAREMRPLLPAMRELTAWLSRQAGQPPQPESILAHEIDEQRRDANGAKLGPMSHATSAAIVALTWSASGHLDGLRRLLGSVDEVPHPHALVSLGRGAVENAALASWLADPGIAGNERSRRFASYERHGLTEHGKLGLGTDDSRQAVADLDATATEFGWKLSLPTKTQLVALLFGDAKMESANRFGAFGYRVQSAIAHGSFHSLLEFFHEVDDAGAAIVGATGEQAFAMCVLPAVSAIQLLGYQLVLTLGLPAEEWAEVVRRCQKVDVAHLMPSDAGLHDDGYSRSQPRRS